jgi:hypothetical protein
MPRNVQVKVAVFRNEKTRAESLHEINPLSGNIKSIIASKG